MIVNRSKKILFVAMFCFGSTAASACDQCITNQIRLSFEAINTSVKALKQSIDATEQAISKLNSQIKSSASDNVQAIKDFTDTIESALDSSTDKISAQIDGITNAMSGNFKILGKIESDLALKVNNHISTKVKEALNVIATNDALYQAGGLFGHFNNGKTTDWLVLLYEENLRKAKTLFVKHASFVKEWNGREGEFNSNGRTTTLKNNITGLVNKADGLLFELSNSNVLTKESYADLVSFLAAGINPEQIEASSSEYLNITARQSEMLTRIIYKAPIVGLTEKNHALLESSLVTAPFSPDACPDDAITHGQYCTSLYNILESLTLRTTTDEYALSLSLASERAIQEEILRTSAINNMILRFENQLQAQHEITSSLQ